MMTKMMMMMTMLTMTGIAPAGDVAGVLWNLSLWRILGVALELEGV
jgi:hypothetical protein